jgi:hypothetical protein
MAQLTLCMRAKAGMASARETAANAASIIEHVTTRVVLMVSSDTRARNAQRVNGALRRVKET